MQIFGIFQLLGSPINTEGAVFPAIGISPVLGLQTAADVARGRVQEESSSPARGHPRITRCLIPSPSLHFPEIKKNPKKTQISITETG